MASTLLLDRTAWDLCVDATNNIAVASEPYSIVQDVASAARLFLGELYYGPATRGVPYWTDAFGKPYPTQLLRSKLIDAAMGVPGVTSAKVYLASGAGRSVTGQIQITTTTGAALVVTF